MGSWNKTCGLSNLHIIAGTDVYVFVLERNKDMDERCYSTAFYSPLLLPFYSKYNDYGGGEESSGVGLPFILDGLKDRLVEFGVGENEYHDVAVKKADFNEELFFDAVHEDRLRVKTYKGDTAVEFVMFRKAVADDILDNWCREKYVGEGKGTTGYSNNYITYKFADVLADLPEFLDKLETLLKVGYSYDDPTVITPSLRLRMLGGLSEVFEWRHPNKVSWYMVRDNYRYSQLVNVHELIIESVANGDRMLAEQLMTDHLKAVYLDSFMHEVRKVWIPGAHEGSQTQEHVGYHALIGAMTRALEVERKSWEEDDEE